MRPIAVLATLLLSACAAFRYGNEESVGMNVRVAPDTALRIASTQLIHHGFDVSPVGDDKIVTHPAALPAHLRDEADRQRPRRWVIQVTSNRVLGISGTRVEVQGFLVPASAEGPQGTATAQQLIPITSENDKLFREVRTIAGWIGDAVKRR